MDSAGGPFLQSGCFVCIPHNAFSNSMEGCSKTRPSRQMLFRTTFHGFLFPRIKKYWKNEDSYGCSLTPPRSRQYGLVWLRMSPARIETLNQRAAQIQLHSPTTRAHANPFKATRILKLKQVLEKKLFPKPCAKVPHHPPSGQAVFLELSMRFTQMCCH